ncbi:glutathione S-transferase family protein [Pseudovibrio denitrificans]|uniref:glutathione S-transferase family protein n=1 Tax=Pseudovibrio denitrificans TaxID=258256 RepID=UPI0039BFCA4D
MVLSLYTISGAPRGWRVLLGLVFKGLSADVIYLKASEKEHKQPEFTALNPRATVPVLTSDHGVLRDSIAILAWLDRAYPEKPLFGHSPEVAAEIWQLTMECCDYLREANRQLLVPVFAGDGSSPEAGSDAARQLNAAAELAHAECRYLEGIFSDGRAYLCGDEPSAADAIAFPEVRLIQRAVETKHDLMASLGFMHPPDLYPFVAAWKTRLNEDPRVEATMPTHWQAPQPAH